MIPFSHALVLYTKDERHDNNAPVASKLTDDKPVEISVGPLVRLLGIVLEYTPHRNLQRR
ncbi:hypothetical protein JG688_00001664 [Phytophthora aleatoria]|uniref:Uncharacterized protein n=1 Tax=Phytophthora aleatoria TaxID=2496075 RepID=A0A8J5M9B7_9STRA|nr:hypothetical protein JG688_00001664 [Phytophthora aleatoria]